MSYHSSSCGYLDRTKKVLSTVGFIRRLVNVSGRTPTTALARSLFIGSTWLRTFVHCVHQHTFCTGFYGWRRKPINFKNHHFQRWCPQQLTRSSCCGYSFLPSLVDKSCVEVLCWSCICDDLFVPEIMGFHDDYQTVKKCDPFLEMSSSKSS